MPVTLTPANAIPPSLYMRSSMGEPEYESR